MIGFADLRFAALCMTTFLFFGQLNERFALKQNFRT
ncbi:hypothetical protein SAMN04515668_3410 [Hymenobacter arizonensis]|uniref:Uncharacterized protein n=1 Tax=Hymenobacter arizonensis TaxID=1227077 RepID=A0A1I6A830_HYMAR|nr:hypothetical protein SAMN04515668_3410 [Hymenobacter arizonensis]